MPACKTHREKRSLPRIMEKENWGHIKYLAKCRTNKHNSNPSLLTFVFLWWPVLGWKLPPGLQLNIQILITWYLHHLRESQRMGVLVNPYCPLTPFLYLVLVETIWDTTGVAGTAVVKQRLSPLGHLSWMWPSPVKAVYTLFIDPSQCVGLPILRHPGGCSSDFPPSCACSGLLKKMCIQTTFSFFNPNLLWTSHTSSCFMLYS